MHFPGATLVSSYFKRDFAIRTIPGQQYVATVALVYVFSAKNSTRNGGAATLSDAIPHTLEEQPSPHDKELGSLG